MSDSKDREPNRLEYSNIEIIPSVRAVNGRFRLSQSGGKSLRQFGFGPGPASRGGHGRAAHRTRTKLTQTKVATRAPQLSGARMDFDQLVRVYSYYNMATERGTRN